MYTNNVHVWTVQKSSSDTFKRKNISGYIYMTVYIQNRKKGFLYMRRTCTKILWCDVCAVHNLYTVFAPR